MYLILEVDGYQDIINDIDNLLEAIEIMSYHSLCEPKEIPPIIGGLSTLARKMILFSEFEFLDRLLLKENYNIEKINFISIVNLGD